MNNQTKENKALIYAEKWGIIEYTVKGNVMRYYENFTTQTVKCELNLNTMLEKRTILKRRRK